MKTATMYRTTAKETAKSIRFGFGLRSDADLSAVFPERVVEAIAAREAFFVMLGNFRADEDGSAKDLIEHGRQVFEATLAALRGEK